MPTSTREHASLAPDAVVIPGLVTAPAPPPLSEAAQRVSTALDIPVTALPGVEAEHPAYVREHSDALNRLIEGRPAPWGAASVLAAHLAAAGWQRSAYSHPPAFSGLWEHGSVPALDRAGLRGQEEAWRRGMARPRWTRLAETLHTELDFAAVWRDILGGDFDVTGRGAEYTRGMEVFQASRWLGARTLLELVGARGDGVFLDVLGGDGYVWRLLQAERGAAAPRLALLRCASPGGGDASPLPDEVAAAAGEVHAADPDAWILAAGRPAESGDVPAMLLRREGGRLAASPVLPLSPDALARLERLPGTVWHVPGAPFRARRAFGDALMVTNDLSPHMFTRAGAWGFPAREDARRLSRSFCHGAFDGVLFAYGTHHIDDLGAALAEGWKVVRPGGTVVVHDFLDDGPAGQWFHRVVDRRSKTGHDFPHVGPVQMAVHLLRAGFRDVRLHEMQDPFLFVSADGERPARELALGYIMGMYGLAQGFSRGPDELEEEIRGILTYPELGEVPVLGNDVAYIPRRAVVAVARRPLPGEAPRSEDDVVLAHTLARLFRRTADELVAALSPPPAARRYWFTPGGDWWGVTPAGRLDFVDWVSAL